MFGRNKDIIEDMEKNDGRSPIVKYVSAGALGVWLTTMAVNEYLLNGDKEEFVQKLAVNEMFCRNPEFETDFRGDPYAALNRYAKSGNYDLLWSGLGDHKIISIPFEYNEVELSRKREYIKELLKDVIDNPDVTFIIAGHASYDLDAKYPFLGAQIPKGFDEENARHMRNNFTVAAKRIEATREILVSLGVSENRILKEINNGSRYDKRAVDLEICTPPNFSPVQL